MCYDFDRTLSPDDMQAQGFIQSVGENVKEFWRQSNELAKSNDMDMNLAYMLTMVKKCKGKFYMTREKLAEYGAGVKLYDGVYEWFDRIYAYGDSRVLIVEHYNISSELQEIIGDTKRTTKFKKTYQR